MSATLATVAVPPETATAPLLTRIVPAASRLSVIVFAAPSPNTVSRPAPELNDATTAGAMRSRRDSRAAKKRPCHHFLRHRRRPVAFGRADFFQNERSINIPPAEGPW